MSVTSPPELQPLSADLLTDVTGILAASDYFQRHPTLRLALANAADLTDYFIRHPELRATTTIDLSDYFLRH